MANLTPMTLDEYRDKTRGTRQSGFRDMIGDEIIGPFLALEIVAANAGTFAEMSTELQDETMRQKNADGLRTICARINQPGNRDRWHVFAKAVALDPASSALSLTLVNETLEAELIKADNEAKQAAK